MYFSIKFVFSLVLVAGLTFNSVAFQDSADEPDPASQVLELLHEEYPPYIYTSDGKVVGTEAALVIEILGRAGFRVKWRMTNYRRLVREIQLSGKPLCAPGYSQSHQESYGVAASKPFAWFAGTALAIRKTDIDLFSKHTSIFDVMNDQQLRGAFLMGARYQGVDENVRAGKVDRHILIGSTDVELGLLVARGRVHFALINPDQTNYLIENNEPASNLMVFQPTDMAGPRQVGFICSEATTEDILDRINASIEPLGPYKATLK